MRLLVTGGTGTLGRVLVPQLVAGGHDVSVLSRRDGVAVRRGDLATGAGLDAAVRGAEVVVHGATNPVKARKVDVAGTQRLLDAAGRAGVKHFVYVSIVGVDRHPLSYYRAKLAAEELVVSSGIPWTIQRASQFHELIARVLRVTMRWPFGIAPHAQLQPITASDTARRLVELVGAGAPAGRADDIAGPEVRDYVSLAEAWRRAFGIRAPFVTLRIPGKVAAGFRAGLTTAPDHKYGTVTWEQWLDELRAHRVP